MRSMEVFKAFGLTALSALGAVSLLSNSSIAQQVPIRVGVNYAEARQNLINNGWQPYQPPGAMRLACNGKLGSCQYQGGGENPKSFLDGKISLRGTFRKSNMYETIHCYGTGAGWCFNLFTDMNGNELIVRTGSGYGYDLPSIDKYYFVSNSDYVRN